MQATPEFEVLPNSNPRFDLMEFPEMAAALQAN